MKEGHRCIPRAFLGCNPTLSSSYKWRQHKPNKAHMGDLDSLGKVSQHAVLHLESIRIFRDISVTLITVEVLFLVNARVVEVREVRPSSAGPRVSARHMVDDRIYQRSVA